ncbi:MAG: methyl-accepting chemotaxis protein [Bacterioplanes sp.]|nr:methyl-accepting chemotaxis protein [Bacterioplanes sp.]
MLRQISIKARLTTLIVVPIVVIIAVIALLLDRMVNLNHGISSLYHDRVVPLQQIKATSDRYGIDIVDTLHKHRGQLLNATTAQTAIAQARQQGQQQWQRYKATELTPDETQLITQVERQLTIVEPLIDRYLAAIQNGSFLQQNNSEFNRTLYDTFDPLTQSLDHLITLQLEVAGEFTRQSEQQFEQLFWLLIAASSLLIVILTIIGSMMYRSINQPIHELRTTIRDIAQHSDLTRTIAHHGNDEISHLSHDFSQMISSFQRVIQRLRDAVAQSSTAAEEMSAISHQVSQTVKDQEAQVIAVATAITEMSGAVKEVANNANQTSHQATEADEKTRQGSDQVQDNLKAIQTLSQSITSASNVIKELHVQSGNITEVLTVIRNIAEQTNLLALNAAIESARAGEAGRGFAVVADEVRKLAQNTQEATESIGSMINQLQQSAQNAVSTMGQASSQASDSVIYAEAAGSILADIAQSVGRIADMNFQVSTATEEQSQVANEINENISRFSLSLADVAQSAEQSALASQEIARLSVDLQQQVSQFKA